jgi:predicted Zn-dependent peptidase
MTVVFAGNFNWEKEVQLIAQRCSDWQKQVVDRITEDCQGTGKADRLSKPNLMREHICLLSPAVSMQDDRRFAASLLASIVGDSVGSRYFWTLVDKALAETASMQCESMDGTGAFYSYVRCSSENLQKVLDEIKGVFDELENKGVTEDELAKSKNKILSSLVLRNEIPMGRLISVGFNWVYRREYQTTEQDITDIKSVTVDDANSLIKNLKPGRFTIFNLGPESSK